MAIPTIGTLGDLNQSAGLALAAQRYMGESMVRMGDEIGKTISDRQMYGDAQKVAPFMQNAFLDSFNDIAGGNYAQGLSKSMMIVAQNASNPITARIAQQGMQTATDLTNHLVTQQTAQMVYGNRGARVDQAEAYRLDNEFGALNEKYIREKGMLEQITDPQQRAQQENNVNGLKERIDNNRSIRSNLGTGTPQASTGSSGRPALNGRDFNAVAGNVDFKTPNSDIPQGDLPQGEAGGQAAQPDIIGGNPIASAVTTVPASATANPAPAQSAPPSPQPPPITPVAFDKAGKVVIEEPPQGDVASSDAIAWVAKYRSPEVYSKLTPDQKQRVDNYQNETLDEGDDKKVEALIQSQQPKKNPNVVETPLDLQGSGMTITAVNKAKQTSKNISSTPSGTSITVDEKDAALPPSIAEHVGKYNDGWARLPDQAKESVTRLGGLGNVSLDVSQDAGAGDGKTFIVRVKQKGASGQGDIVQQRDPSTGLLSNMTISKDDAHAIDGAKSALATLTGTRDLGAGYAVKADNSNYDQKASLKDYQQSLTPSQPPFGIDTNGFIKGAGIDVSKLTPEQKSAAMQGVWSVFDSLQKDPKKGKDFRDAVVGNPDKAAGMLSVAIGSGEDVYSQKLRELIPSAKQAPEVALRDSPMVKGIDPALLDQIAPKDPKWIESALGAVKKGAGEVLNTIASIPPVLALQGRYQPLYGNLMDLVKHGKITSDEYNSAKEALDANMHKEWLDKYQPKK